MGVTAAVLGGAAISAVGGMMAADSQASAAESAAAAQTASTEASIIEQRRQFDAIQALLSPYVSAGTTAVSGLQPYTASGAQAYQQQAALSGALGSTAQQQAISAIEQGPLYSELMQQGENAILQNAAATGGLRGGNTQAALAQYRPQLLNQLISDEYNRLGGITTLGATTQQAIAGLGQASAAQQAAAGQASAANISSALQSEGSANAASALASGAAQANLYSGIGNTASTLGTLYGLGAFGGTSTLPSLGVTAVPGTTTTGYLYPY